MIITEIVRLAISLDLEKGAKPREVAKKYDVSLTSVYSIRNGKGKIAIPRKKPREAIVADLQKGIHPEDVAKKHGISVSLARLIRREEQIEQAPHCRDRYTPPHSWEIVQLWEQCEKSYKDVAERLCITRGELERLIEYYRLPLVADGKSGQKEGSGQLFGRSKGTTAYPWIHRSQSPALSALTTRPRTEIHRALFMLALGRVLPRQYEVHHINGNIEDFRPENLVLLTRKEHSHIDARDIFKKAKWLRKTGNLELADIAEKEAIRLRDGWRADPQSLRVMEGRHLAALGRDEHYLPRLNQAYEQINALWQEWIRTNGTDSARKGE